MFEKLNFGVFKNSTYPQGIYRNQLHLSSLVNKIAANNLIRFIDTLVELIDLTDGIFNLSNEEILKK